MSNLLFITLVITIGRKRESVFLKKPLVT